MGMSKYSDNEVAFLKENYPKMSAAECTDLLNKKFMVKHDVISVRGFCHRARIKRGNIHIYSDEEKKYMDENYNKMKASEFANAFNNKFNCNINPSTLKGYCNKRGLISKNPKGFTESHTPWNKGVKGNEYDKHYTADSRKKIGRGASRYKVGDEVKQKNGYTFVKLADKKWVFKQRYVYEQFYNIKIPDNHSIYFKDGNIENFDIDNLIMISKEQMGIMTSWDAYKKGKFTELYANAAKCLLKANKLENESEKI